MRWAVRVVLISTQKASLSLADLQFLDLIVEMTLQGFRV